MELMGEKGHYQFKLYCKAEQSAVTNASVKLSLALALWLALKHRQQNGEWCVYQFILFFQFKVISLLN